MSHPPDASEQQGLPFPRRIYAVIAMSIGAMMLMIDSSMVAVALPTIAESLGVKDSETMLVVTIYQLTLAMSGPVPPLVVAGLTIISGLISALRWRRLPGESIH